MGIFEKLGLALMVLAVGAVAFVRHGDALGVSVPVSLSLDLLFVAMALALAGFVTVQLQTFLTPTPGRVAMTSGFVVIGLALLGYVPAMAWLGGVGLLGVGALLRQVEVFEEVVR